MEFNEINSDQEVIRRLSQTYRNVNELDPIIGILAEEHLEDSTLGETGYYIIKEQFERIRDGDRLFYLNDPDLEDLREDISNTKLSDVIKRNTRIDDVPDNVFFVSEIESNYSASEQRTLWTYVLVLLSVVFVIYVKYKNTTRK